jgi:hypothetical protein
MNEEELLEKYPTIPAEHVLFNTEGSQADL